MSVFLSWTRAGLILFVTAIASIHSAAADETPYITTQARPLYLRPQFPNRFVTEGGSVNFIALQLRLALSERLGFIANPDGVLRPGGRVRALPHVAGFTDAPEASPK